MAKSGKLKINVAVVDPPNASQAAVADVTPVVETAGAAVVDVMRASAEPIGVVSAIPKDPTLPRMVVAYPTASGAGQLAAVAGLPGALKVAELTFDGGALKNAPMSNSVADNVHNLAARINARIAAQKPTFSVASIINAIEDEAKESEGNVNVIVAVDQATEKVTVYKVTNEARSALYDAVVGESTLALDVDTTPEATPSNQFGE